MIQKTQSCEHIQVSGGTDKQGSTVKPDLLKISGSYIVSVLQSLSERTVCILTQ